MNRLISFLLFIASSLLIAPARGEYRAFQLAIMDETTQTERMVISTFDDIQFPMYHPIRKAESIRIADTWMCWGRTDQFKPICPNPKSEDQPAPENRVPASQPTAQPSP